MAKVLRREQLNKMEIFDYLNYIFVFVMSLAFIYPLLLTLSISLSNQKDLSKIITFLPMDITLDSYKFLLEDGRILRYYANSVFYAVSGTLVFLLFTSMMAYPFIVKTFKGRKFFNLYMVITMFFGGGLIPYYYMLRSLNLSDTIWVMIIPGAVGAYNVIIFRTFFSEIPAALRESAYMDGAGHYTILFRILLPMSKPLLATFALFSMVGKWNDFFTPMLFIRSDELLPVQSMLRRLLILMEFRDKDNVDMQTMFMTVTTRTIKSAAVIITIAPIICVYPFLQKYFTKGILVGSLKA